MISIAALKALVAAGATGEMIVAAVEASQQEEEKRLANGRERAKRYRQNRSVTLRHVTQRDVTNDALSLSKEDKKDKIKKERAAERKHLLPEDWHPGLPISSADVLLLEQMRDWARANGIRRADWAAQFRNFKRKREEWRQNAPIGGRSGYDPKREMRDAMQQLRAFASGAGTNGVGASGGASGSNVVRLSKPDGSQSAGLSNSLDGGNGALSGLGRADSG